MPDGRCPSMDEVICNYAIWPLDSLHLHSTPTLFICIQIQCILFIIGFGFDQFHHANLGHAHNLELKTCADLPMIMKKK